MSSDEEMYLSKSLNPNISGVNGDVDKSIKGYTPPPPPPKAMLISEVVANTGQDTISEGYTPPPPPPLALLQSDGGKPVAQTGNQPPLPSPSNPTSSNAATDSKKS